MELPRDTRSEAYAERLERLAGAPWKRWVPQRWESIRTHARSRSRARGHRAWLPDAFRASPVAVALVAQWLDQLRPGGKLSWITPQEAGFRSDPSHVEFLDFGALRALLVRVGCETLRVWSFPLPRFAGRVLPHNEFVVLGRRSA